MKYLVLVIMGMVSPAFANPSLVDIGDVPNKFELLRGFYEAAGTPAQVTDFDAHDADSNQKCVAVMHGSDELLATNIKVHTTIIPGQPSRGPLFPGTPDREEKKVMLLAYLGDFERLAGYFHNESTATDLVIWTDETSYMDRTPWRVLLRKSDDLIFFHGWLKYALENAVELYGYCYRE